MSLSALPQYRALVAATVGLGLLLAGRVTAKRAHCRQDCEHVADWGNERIQKFDSQGTFLLAWGSHGSAPGQFQTPNGLATGSGSVYVTETGGNRVQRFDPGGGFLDTWGATGAGAGQFQYPFAAATDASGNVYVADQSNNRIQKFACP